MTHQIKITSERVSKQMLEIINERKYYNRLRQSIFPMVKIKSSSIIKNLNFRKKMKNQTVKQFIGLALLILMATCAKSQTYYPVGYVGAAPLDWGRIVYVDNKNQTVHLEGVDSVSVFDNTYLEHIVNGIATIVPLGGSVKLWHTSSYLGKYRMRTRSNGSTGSIIYELQFYIKQKQ